MMRKIAKVTSHVDLRQVDDIDFGMYQESVAPRLSVATVTATH